MTAPAAERAVDGSRHVPGLCRLALIRGALLAAGLILAVAATWTTLGAASHVHAQESPRLASLEIEIWPEYDRQAEVLVILRGQVAEEVSLPAAVSLRIPASSGGPWAVASTPSEGAPLLTRSYDVTSAEDSLLLTFTTPHPMFQVEFYDPLQVDGENRSYSYIWPGDLAVDQLIVAVQEPAGASAPAIEPELGEGVTGADGLVYRTAEMGPLEAGKTLTVNLRYLKTDPRTSLEILSPGETGTDGGVPTWAILAAAIAALAVVGGVVLYRRWRAIRPAAAPTGPAPGTRGEGQPTPRSRKKPTSQASCAQCGARLRRGHRFCPRCGAAREE